MHRQVGFHVACFSRTVPFKACLNVGQFSLGVEQDAIIEYIFLRDFLLTSGKNESLTLTLSTTVHVGYSSN